MTDKTLHRVSLKWTYEKSRLLAETECKPANSIEMECRIGYLKDDGRFAATPPVQGIWDTGTSTTIVTPAVAQRLGLKPLPHQMNMNGLGGTDKADVCVACIIFPNGMAVGPLYVAVHDLPSIDVLIGMDVISFGTLKLERKPDGGTRFTFDM